MYSPGPRGPASPWANIKVSRRSTSARWLRPTPLTIVSITPAVLSNGQNSVTIGSVSGSGSGGGAGGSAGAVEDDESVGAGGAGLGGTLAS